MDEQELASRCHRGDNAARRELYETYGSRLLSLCRRYAVDAADAEDLMQDSFVKIFRVIGRFRWTRPGSLYSWMARVALNLAFDSARKRKRIARDLVDVDGLKGEVADEPDYEQTASVPAEAIHRMIAALPDGYRTVLRGALAQGDRGPARDQGEEFFRQPGARPVHPGQEHQAVSGRK